MSKMQGILNFSFWYVCSLVVVKLWLFYLHIISQQCTQKHGILF